MKRNILILFAVVSLLISLTGCGGSGHSNSVAPVPTTMTSVRVSLSQNGQSVTGADVALYTPAAAMREGLTQAQNNSSRASISNSNTEGVYRPTSTSADGIYTFNVPTGEYTLIASKGDSKAVVTNLRAASNGSIAEGDVTPTVVTTDLKPTGTIEGTVIAPSGLGISVAGSIVYLANTSFVAIAAPDGSFRISGVPTSSNPYTITATSNQKGGLFTSESQSVPMKSDNLIVTGISLTLSENKNNVSYKIQGSVKNSSSKVAVIVSDGNNLIVGTSEDNGTFNIGVKSAGNYIVTVIGSEEGSKDVSVSSDGSVSPTSIELVFSLNSTKSTSEYGTVKGIIKVSSDYMSFFADGNNEYKMPLADRYLVRLIGSSTTETFYSTQTRVEYKSARTQDGTAVNYIFDSVPKGTYSVFVDPAGNGFWGSVGNVTVTEGQTTSDKNIDVNYVQPEFTVVGTSSGIEVTEKYPCMMDKASDTEISPDVTLTAREMSTQVTETPMPLSSPSNSGLIHSYYYVPPNDKKLEIVVTKKWDDANVTGQSGVLAWSQIVEVKGTSSYIGNVEIVNNSQISGRKIKASDLRPEGATTEDIDVLGLTFIESGGNGIYTAWSNTKKIYYKDSLYNYVYHCENQSDDNGLSTIFDASDRFVIANKNDFRTYCFEFTSNGLEDYLSLNVNNTHSFNMEGKAASIIAGKYIAVCDESIVKVFTHDSSTNSIQALTNGEYPIIEANSVVDNPPKSGKLAMDSSKTNCYISILYKDQNRKDIKIYNLANSQTAVATLDISNFSTINSITGFKVLKNGNYYIETDSKELAAVIFNSNSSNNIVDKSSLSNRRSCLLDKQGFMYRFDATTKKVIQTASLDGEPLATYSESNELSG
ncbi:MAG: hypothetical protein IKO19_02310, partial [Candidatus Riflebacteria bacterium]|nr:hypothetical protein [Candidatus Riflebacteria bacterium]